MNNNYELGYWEKRAIEQLQNWQPMTGAMPRSFGKINNNRKRTMGRKIQVIKLSNGGTRQIRKPTLN